MEDESQEIINLFCACIDDENQENQQAAFNKLYELVSDPNIIQPIIQILSDLNSPIRLRQFISTIMHKVIQNSFDNYVDNAPDIFNGLIEALLNETDTLIARSVSYALFPLFQSYGDDWEAMVEFLNKTCTADLLETNIIGTIFLAEFIPCVSDAFISQIHEVILTLLKKILISESVENIEYGFKLFEAIQTREYDKDSELSAAYTEIFGEMLKYYHLSLINQSSSIGVFTLCIRHSFRSDILFDSVSNIFRNLMEIISDETIPEDFRHYPLIAIKSLVKYHPKALKEIIAPAIPLFLNISISQFQNIDYANEGGSRTIIKLFEHLSSVTNGDEFFNYLKSLLCQNEDAAASFASLCALFGSSEQLIEQFDQNMEFIVTYIFSKLEIESKPVVEICLIMLCDFIEGYSHSISFYIDNIFPYAFKFATNEDFDVAKDAILLITTIFENIDLETSVVLSHLANLREFYLNSNLKPQIMDAIGACISACGEDFNQYSNLVADIIDDGIKSDDLFLVISSMEALGHLIRNAPNTIGDLYTNGIELICSRTPEKDENGEDIDIDIRTSSITALYYIVNQACDFSANGEKIEAFIPTVFTIATLAIGTRVDDEQLYSEDKKPQALIESGFLLLKALFKYHSEECVKASADFGKMIEAFGNQINDFMKFVDNDIAVKAIKASVYYIIHYQPEGSSLLETYCNLIQNGEEIDQCKAAFRAYNKLLVARYPPALSEEVFTKFVELTISALNRNLLCQRMDCECEEDRFNFNYSLLEPVYTVLNELFKINIEYFKPDEFLKVISDLKAKVDEIESFEILGTLGSYIMAGGVASDDMIQYAFSLLTAIDYQKGPDAIFFIRSLIKNHPDTVAGNAESLVQFYIAQLSTDVSAQMYYWSYMTNVISSVFEMAKSEAFASLINMQEFLPLILNKLPVQGDYDESEFIYDSLIEYLRSDGEALNQNSAEIFRVVVLTLSLKSSTLNKCKLPNETIASLVELMNGLMPSQPENSILEILGEDEVRKTRLENRLGGN